MELQKFRIAHSTLIEHYQFIECHLEGIYAAVSQKELQDSFRDVEKGSLNDVVREIKRLERQQKIRIFTPEEYEALYGIFQRRNFWCHSCYCELSFDMETGGPARVRDVKQMLEDMEVAEQWRDRLFEKKVRLLKENEKI